MKFTVTPVRADTNEIDAAVKDTVDYLTGKAPDMQRRPLVGPFTMPDESQGDGAASAVGYYQADQLEGDGWWSGRGAVGIGVDGVVDSDVLAVLLSGRDPETGVRLISASGTTGRSGVKRGRHTRLVGGALAWDVADAAACFDANQAEAVVVADGMSETYFIRDEDGAWWLSADGVDELGERLGRRSVNDIDESLNRGDPDELLSVNRCVELTGLSPQRIRKVIKEWVEHEESIEASQRDEALPHARAWLPAVKASGKWAIRRGDLQAFWSRRTPPSVVLGYDVTATVEKSVSIMALLGGDDFKGTVLSSLRKANDAGLDWLDQHASRGRRKGSSVGSEGFCVASFLHATSRALDPHAHIHNLVVNVLADPFGGRRTIDGRFLFAEAKTASGLATAQLRWELSRALPGCRWVQHHPNGVWELAGISPEMIEEFSNRRADIEQAAALFQESLGRLPTRAELQDISRNTRQQKKVVVAAELLGDWLDRASKYGFDPHQVATAGPIYRQHHNPVLGEDERDELFRFLAEHPDGACFDESTFSFGDLVVAINRWSVEDPTAEGHTQPRVMPASTVSTLANEFLTTQLSLPVVHQGQLIKRTDGRTVGTAVQEQRWTTPHMVKLQSEIVSWWGRGVGEGHLDRTSLKDLDDVSGRVGLGIEQRDLLANWTLMGDQFQAAIGRPGTGKTFTMRAAKELWEDAGYTVLGAAVKGTAAQHLNRETGIQSETVAHYFAAADAGIEIFDAETVVVVDEATTLSDRDLHRLMTLCRTSGAALRMIGDPKQQQSVAAGGMWEQMITLYGDRTPELREQRRLQDPIERTTANLIRDGRVTDAFNALLAAGKVQQADTPTEAELLAIRGWVDRHRRGVNSPMIDRRNGVRRRLNQIAQAIRIADGEVTRPEQFGELQVGIGDHVIAHRPNRDLFPETSPGNYMSNGSTGTVTAIDETGVTVDFEGLGDITVPQRAVRSHLSLGYAITAYSVQGLTLEEAEATVRPGESINSLYVELTRGRNSNTIITTRSLPREAHLPTLDDPSKPVTEVAESVHDTHYEPALVADPDLDTQRTNPHKDTQGAGRPSDPNFVRAVDTDTDRFARLCVTHPPQEFEQRYPRRPTEVPWLAHRWNSALAALASYRYRWNPPPGAVLTGSEPELGTTQHHDWWLLNDTLASNALSIISYELGGQLGQDASVTADLEQTAATPTTELSVPTTTLKWPWFNRLIRDAIHHGHITPTTDYRSIAQWARDINASRLEAGISPTDPLCDEVTRESWQRQLERAPTTSLARQPST